MNPSSGGGQELQLASSSSRSKQAMDIRIEELTDQEVQQLTSILSRRPSFGIGRPSKRWLEHQAKLVSRLPSEVKRPSNIIKRFVVKYASDRSAFFECPPAVLCSTHYELHPRLMRRLFVVVLDEVTRHADRLRRWVASTNTTSTTGDELLDPDTLEMLAFVDRVDGLGALWMEPELYLSTFHAPPSDRRMVKVESFCEACTLAVLGASARTLADIRAIIVDRAERLRDRRERRLRGREEERQRRERRREEKREKRRLQWEDEERLLLDVKRDPELLKERERWVRSGRAADPDRERHQVMLDEVEARHRRNRDRDRDRESRHHRSRHSSRGRGRSHHRRQSRSHHNREDDHDEQQQSHNRAPRLLRIVELWIDHLGPERAPIARAMSDDLLVLLRHYRRNIDQARPDRRVRKRVHRRNGIPVAGAAPAGNPQAAADLRRKATDFYRNTDAARSVYRPDSLAGGDSQLGVGERERLPPLPLCGTGIGTGIGGRPGAPEPAGVGRVSGFTTNSNQPPSPAFIRRFEREFQVRDGTAGSGLDDPYEDDGDHGGGAEEGGEYYYDDDLDEELEEEEEEQEEEEEDEYNDARGMQYYHAGAEAERDLEREERSREKVAAWAVNTWAESHRDLSGADLERGAQSVIDGMHPAFRPNNNDNPAGSSLLSRRESAVPPPLAVNSSNKGKERERGHPPPLSPSSGAKKAAAMIGSAIGITRSNSSSKKRRAEEEARDRDRGREKGRERSREKGKERERDRRGTTAGLKEKPQRRETAATTWTDATVQSDFRDRSGSGHHHRRPLPVPSLVAGIDPNQSTEAFPSYADPPLPLPPHGLAGQQSQQQSQSQAQVQAQSQQRPQTPDPWVPAKKPSRKYCFPDSDIGSVVQRNVDRQYLKKNRGFIREVPPGAYNPFASSSVTGASSRYSSSVGGDGGGAGSSRVAGDGNPISPGAEDDPWVAYERAASVSNLSLLRSGGGGGGGTGGGGSSQSTAPTSAMPPPRHMGSSVGSRAPTPRVATAEEEREWRRRWGNLEEEEEGADAEYLLPDDSASNLQWARQRSETGVVTQMSDFMKRADGRRG